MPIETTNYSLSHQQRENTYRYKLGTSDWNYQNHSKNMFLYTVSHWALCILINTSCVLKLLSFSVISKCDLLNTDQFKSALGYHFY